MCKNVRISVNIVSKLKFVKIVKNCDILIILRFDTIHNIMLYVQ